MTEEDYIAAEMEADSKHEFENGMVIKMLSENRKHNLIKTNLSIDIGGRLGDMPFYYFSSDMKVYSSYQGHKYYYPDVAVTSVEIANTSDYVIDDPIFIVEILSTNTELRDRNVKLSAYLHIKTLREYILISHEEKKVSVYRKIDNKIEYREYSAGAIFVIDSLKLRLSVDQIYRGTDIA